MPIEEIDRIFDVPFPEYIKLYLNDIYGETLTEYELNAVIFMIFRTGYVATEKESSFKGKLDLARMMYKFNQKESD